jgi:hypothetical protein
MKTLKMGMSVLAWVGICFWIVGVAFLAIETISLIRHPALPPYPPVPARPNISLYSSLVGIGLTSVGGIIGKPRYVWPVLVLLGIIYCVFLIVRINLPSPYFISIRQIYPGVFSIVIGLIIYWLRYRKTNKTKA